MVVLPGKYLLSDGKIVSREELPAKDFYQTPMKEWKIANHTWPEFTADKEVTFRCEVFGPKRPQQVDVYLMLKPWGCKRIPMTAEDGFFYTAKADISWLAKGDYEYHFGIDTGDDTILFPEKTYCTPERWDYYEQATYAMRLINETIPLSLLGPQDNWKHIRRTRTFRSPESQFSSVVSGPELLPAFQLSVPDLEKKEDYIAPCDVTFSHYIGDRITCRSKSKTAPAYIRIRAYGLNNTDKAICNFVDKEGNYIGRHKGIIHYTIGQRRGLGIPAASRLYVCEISPKTNTVVLGDNADLFSSELEADSVNLISVDSLAEPKRVTAKIRYRHKEQPATAWQTPDGILHVKFDEPQRAITKGQAVVMYDGDEVVGGGVINKIYSQS